MSFGTPEYRLFVTIPVAASYISSDGLGNFYIVRKNVIDKYSINGTLQSTFSNKSFGDISHIDVSNPLKPLLFYKEFAQLVFLDNMMTVHGGPVRLEERGFQDVQLAASSHNNGIWLYTAQNSELMRLDEQMEITHRTGNLRQQLGADISPVFMIENNNRVFLNSPSVGVLIFDVFGTYHKTVPLMDLDNFQVQEDNIIYRGNGTLYSYNIKTLAADSFAIPDTAALSVRVEKERMCIRKEKSVDIYTIR